MLLRIPSITHTLTHTQKQTVFMALSGGSNIAHIPQETHVGFNRTSSTEITGKESSVGLLFFIFMKDEKHAEK